MKTENGIPILDGDDKNDEQQKYYALIATNAFRTMTDSLVKMEKAGLSDKDMMGKCVWPIIYEAARRFDAIAQKDFDTPTDGFEFVVG